MPQEHVKRKEWFITSSGWQVLSVLKVEFSTINTIYYTNIFYSTHYIPYKINSLF